MAFIRLSDNYVDHPKFLALSAAAFRLWHEGMAFCRKHQTDGLIPSSTLQGFRYYKAGLVTELATPAMAGMNPLWDRLEGAGYQVHDYLFWNLSKTEEQAEKDGATKRMRDFRNRQRYAVTPTVTNAVTNGVRAPFVQDRIGRGSKALTERESERKPSAPVDVGSRAGHLIEAYAAWYSQYRHGAKLRLIGNSLEFQDACSLCETWEDQRLEKLARIVLTTDDDFISGTDRGFKIFALKASWADDRLRQAEKAVAS